MEVLVTINDRHRLRVELDAESGAIEKVVPLHDLAQYNLFKDPTADNPASVHAFVPFAESVRGAFAGLEYIDSAAPLGAALIHYRDTRLAKVLEAVKTPPEPMTQELRDRLNESLETPAGHQALKQLVARIEREVPHYFAIEKDLGTFAWLAEGASSANPGFNIRVENLEMNEMRPGIRGSSLVSPVNGRVIYHHASDTGYLSEALPGVTELWRGLSEFGCLPQSLHELNSVAAVRHAATQLEVFSSLYSVGQQPWWNSWSTYGLAAGSFILAGVCAGSGAALLSSGIVDWVAGVKGADVSLIRIGGAALGFSISTMLAKGIARVYNLVRAGERFIAEQNSEIDEKVVAVPLTTLTSTLVKYIESASYGSSQFPLASDSTVVDDLYQARSIDPGITPEVRKVSVASELSLDPQDFFSRFREAAVSSPCVYQAVAGDVAYQSWNLIHAIRLIKDVVELQKGRTNPVSLRGLLSAAQVMATGENSEFDVLVDTLRRAREVMRVSDGDWPHVARAMFAVDLLERQAAQGWVCGVAREELGRFGG